MYKVIEINWKKNQLYDNEVKLINLFVLNTILVKNFFVQCSIIYFSPKNWAI